MGKTVCRVLAFGLSAVFGWQAEAQLPGERCASLLQGDRAAEAERCAQSILDKNGREALALEVLGAVRLRRKDYPEAARLLERAIRSDSGMVGARLDLADALLAEGKSAEAASVLQQAHRVAPESTPVRYALVRAEAAAGEYRRSLADAQPLLGAMRGQEDGLALLISDAAHEQDAIALKGFLEDWAALEDPSAQRAIEVAQVLGTTGNEAAGVSVLRDAEAHHPEDFGVHFLLGELNVRLGERLQAGEQFRSALSLRANSVPSLLALARLARKGNELDEARTLLMDARALEPEDAEVLTELGKVLLQQDRPDEAVKALKQAAALRPDADQTSYLLASAYTSDKQYNEALSILERLEERHRDDALFPYSVGAVQYLGGNYGAAERELRRSLALDPRGIGALYYLGLTLSKEQRLPEAEATFRTLLGVSAQHPAGLTALGEMLLSQHRYAEAKGLLEQAVVLDPASANAHYILGRTLARLGQREASQEQFAIVERLNRPAGDDVVSR